MVIVKSVDELAKELMKVNRAGAVSDAARRHQFTTFAMELPDDFPQDPDSEDYRQRQLDLYREIAGMPYAVANERTHFDVAAMADKPFPFLNEGWEVTGDQLIAIGWLFKVMRLPAKATVLEFGPGWGNTTLALAQNGYAVTAIEIEPNFVALIQERARRLNVAVEVLEGDFLDASRLDRTFDAVLFFESFHHCANHNALFDLLPSLLSPDGIAVFCAEPIDESFRYPWSLRLDGQSLWAIRANGWLELGFTESYFVQSLMKRGFLVDKVQTGASPLANCLVARRARGRYDMATFYLPPAQDRTWSEPESDPTLRRRFTSAQSTITLERGGPYTLVHVDLRNFAPFKLPAQVTHGENTVATDVPAHSGTTIVVPYDPAASVLSLRCPTWRPIDFKDMGDDPRTLGLCVSTITLA